MILDIRGTNGSGKSTIVHRLLSRFGNEDVYDEEDNLIGHWIPRFNLAVAGRYKRVCGGTDTIKSADEIEGRIRLLNDNFSIVIAEGIMMSHTFQRYHDLATELEDYRFCFLDTPLDTCIFRVQARRLERGNTKPLNEKWLRSDYHRIWNTTKGRMIDEGHKVLILNHKDPMKQIVQQIKKHRKKSGAV